MAKARTEPAWGEPGDVFAQMEGEWAIERRVSNGATLSGAARFVPAAADELDYAEQGVLRLADGQTFKASRSYVFRHRAHGFAVYFAEEPEKLFHDIALHHEGDALAGGGEHPCRNDLYRSRYTFRPDGSFTLTHIVKGPRYDYEMETVYRRRQGLASGLEPFRVG